MDKVKTVEWVKEWELRGEDTATSAILIDLFGLNNSPNSFAENTDLLLPMDSPVLP